MGDYFQSVVDERVCLSEAPAIAERLSNWLINQAIIFPDKTDCSLGDSGHAPGVSYGKAVESENDEFLSLQSNGMSVAVGRSVFDSGQGGVELICASCEKRFDPSDTNWGNVVGEWFSESGDAVLVCPACGVGCPVIQWQHDPEFGFGNLGFTFWNWPRLSDEFLNAFAEQLGHPVKCVRGQL